MVIVPQRVAEVAEEAVSGHCHAVKTKQRIIDAEYTVVGQPEKPRSGKASRIFYLFIVTIVSLLGMVRFVDGSKAQIASDRAAHEQAR